MYPYNSDYDYDEDFLKELMGESDFIQDNKIAYNNVDRRLPLNEYPHGDPHHNKLSQDKPPYDRQDRDKSHYDRHDRNMPPYDRHDKDKPHYDRHDKDRPPYDRHDKDRPPYDRHDKDRPPFDKPDMNRPPYDKPDRDKPPIGRPPEHMPQRNPGLLRIDPQTIRQCNGEFTYVWLKNGRSFWIYPTYIGRSSLSGYRWSNFGWVYFGLDLDSIESFYCIP